jgi:hypothetical protein
LVCPDEGTGRDVVTLSEGNAAAAKSRTGFLQPGPGGRLDSGGSEYKTTPQSILEGLLIGWWNLQSVTVGGNTDDYLAPGIGAAGSNDSIAYGMLAGLTQAQATAGESVTSPRSGVSFWRNMAKRYDYLEVDSTNPHRDDLLDLMAEKVFSPSFVDDQMIFDAEVGTPAGSWATRRLYNPIGHTIMKAGTNPCVWVVFKPTGNEITASTNPDDHFDYGTLFALRRSYVNPWTSNSNTQAFAIQWGQNINGSNAANKFWHARGVYNAGSTAAYATAALNTDTSRRVYSGRMEATQMVFKVSDTEFTTALAASDDLEYDMSHILVGDFANGEISEVVLTAEQPTASQISDLETYFANSYSDLVETL